MGNFKRFVTLLLTTLMLGSSDGSLAPLQAGSPTVFSQEKDWSPYLVARQSRKARKRATPKGSPTVVQNVRTDDKEDYTRVVLDLQRSVTFTQTRRKNPDRVIIELKNSTLGKSARAKLANKEFPDEVVVSQPHSRAVRVSLDLERLRDYKLLPLMDPPRLVVDIFKDARGANRQGAQAVTNQPRSFGTDSSPLELAGDEMALPNCTICNPSPNQTVTRGRVPVPSKDIDAVTISTKNGSCVRFGRR